MAINYTQTDTSTSGSGSYCAPTGSENQWRVASDGGTAGSSEVSLGWLSSQTDLGPVGFKITPAAGTTWAAGNWTVRFNVTTANMNITITDIFICRVNSSDVNQATIGSATGLSISLGTTGVKSQVISGSAQSPSVGDVVMVMILGDNGSMSSQVAGFTPNQNIDSPFTGATTWQGTEVFAGAATLAITAAQIFRTNPITFAGSAALSLATAQKYVTNPIRFSGDTVSKIAENPDATAAFGQAVISQTGETFLATASTSNVDAVIGFIGALGTPGDAVQCSLYDTSSGLPNTLLASSVNTISASLIGPVAAPFQFNFSPAVKLTVGSKYAAVFSRTSADAGSYFASRTTSSSYPDGERVQFVTTVPGWQADTGDVTITLVNKTGNANLILSAGQIWGTNPIRFGAASGPYTLTITESTAQEQILGASTSDVQLSQTFTPPHAIEVTSVDVNATSISGTPADQVTCDIYNTNGSTPTTLLATVSTQSITTSGVKTFTATSPISLAANTKYALVLSRTGAVDAANFVNFGESNSNVYADGIAFRHQTSPSDNWVSLGVDLYSHIYGNALGNTTFSINATFLPKLGNVVWAADANLVLASQMVRVASETLAASAAFSIATIQNMRSAEAFAAGASLALNSTVYRPTSETFAAVSSFAVNALRYVPATITYGSASAFYFDASVTHGGGVFQGSTVYAADAIFSIATTQAMAALLTFGADANLAIGSSVQRVGRETFTADSSLSVAGSVYKPTSETFQTAATFAINALRFVPASDVFSADAVLSLNAQLYRPTSETFAASATLALDSTLYRVASETFAAGASLSMIGSLSLRGAWQAGASAIFSIATIQRMFVSQTMTASAVFSIDAFIKGLVTASTAWAASAAFAINATRTTPAFETFTASATLALLATQRMRALETFNADASLSIAGSAYLVARETMPSAATWQMSADVYRVAAETWNAASTFALASSVYRTTSYAVAASANLSIATKQNLAAMAGLSASGAFGISVSQLFAGRSIIVAESTFDIAVSIITQAFPTMSAEMVFTIAAEVVNFGKPQWIDVIDGIIRRGQIIQGVATRGDVLDGVIRKVTRL
jgi:hypothetical protein